MSTRDQERRPPKILIVEDETLLARQLDYTLRSLGYEVAGSFATGEEAIQIVKDSEPDLILMDIRLRGDIDGIEAAERIRESLDIPVVFLTAYSETLVLERAQNAEPYGYLGKPVSETDLRSTIETALHKHRADRRVRESEERYRSLYTKTPAMLHSIDAGGKLVSVSDRWLEVLGYERGEALGRPSTDFLTEESRRQAEEIILPKFYLDGFVKDASYQFVKKNGEIIDVLLSATAEFDSQGRFVRSLAVLEDITDRRRAEKAFQEERNKAAGYLDAARVMMLALDREGNVTLVNRKTCEVLEYEEREIVGTNWFENFLPKRDREEVHGVFSQIMSGEVGAFEYYENPVATRSGEERLIAWHNTFIRDDAGLIVSTLASGEDITEKKRAAEQLRKEKETAERYLNTAGVIMVALDREGRVTLINKKGCRVLGHRADEIVGRPWFDTYLPKSDRERTKEGFAQLMAGEVEHARYFENPVLNRNGEQRLIAWYNELFTDEDGNIIGTLSSGEDITERKRAEEDRREALDLMQYIVENDPNAIAVYDRNLHYMAVSKRYLLDYEVKEEDIIGKHHYEVFPEIPQRWKDVHQRCLAGAVESEDDDYFERPDGSVTYNRWECRPWYTSDGEIGGIITYTEVTTERKLAEKALQRERNILEDILEASLAGYWDWDIPGNTEYLSPTFKKMFGYEDDELPNRPETWQRLIFAEDLPGVLELFDRHVKSRGSLPYYNEVRYRHKDGSTVWVICAGRVVEWDEEGNPLRMVGCHVDITERKEAEHELRVSEERYRTVVDNFPKGALFLFDKDFRYKFCGGLGLADIGLKPEDIIGKTVYDVFPPAVYRAVERYCSPVFDGVGEMYQVEYEGRIYENYAVPVLQEDGAISEGLVITLEITDRKKAEDALRESEERYRQLVENANEAIFVVQDGRFRFVNPKCSTTSGYTQQELLSMSFTDLIHEEDLERPLSMHRRRLDGDETPQTYAFRFFDKEGAVKWVNLNSVGILWEGRPAGLCFLSDITEIKKAEELAVVSERLKAVGELAGGVAHNFNNLLQIVLGGSQLAITDLELGDVRRARENLEQIVDSARFGAETVKRLQDFARVRKDDLAVGAKVFDLAETVDEAIEMSKPWWKTKPEKDGVAISLNRYVRKGCLIKGNENELFEVIVNLIKNAAEALDTGGEIRIRTSVEDDIVVLTVEDNGVGIPEENRGRIFEPFWTTKGFHGTGMGLSSSYGIVQRHGGEITVESKLGTPTIFVVRLPLSLEQPKPETRPVRRSVPFEVNVLIVDDIPAVIKQLDGGLTSYGQNVYSASSGPVALEIFREAPIDVVICDLAMPEMNGRQVGEEILKICAERQIPKPIFILLTGWGGQIHEEDKIRVSGVDKILEKPVEIGKLIEVIEELIKQRDAWDG